MKLGGGILPRGLLGPRGSPLPHLHPTLGSPSFHVPHGPRAKSQDWTFRASIHSLKSSLPSPPGDPGMPLGSLLSLEPYPLFQPIQLGGPQECRVSVRASGSWGLLPLPPLPLHPPSPPSPPPTSLPYPLRDSPHLWGLWPHCIPPSPGVARLLPKSYPFFLKESCRLRSGSQPTRSGFPPPPCCLCLPSPNF